MDTYLYLKPVLRQTTAWLGQCRKHFKTQPENHNQKTKEHTISNKRKQVIAKYILHEGVSYVNFNSNTSDYPFPIVPHFSEAKNTIGFQMDWDKGNIFLPIGTWMYLGSHKD